MRSVIVTLNSEQERQTQTPSTTGTSTFETTCWVHNGEHSQRIKIIRSWTTYSKLVTKTERTSWKHSRRRLVVHVRSQSHRTQSLPLSQALTSHEGSTRRMILVLGSSSDGNWTELSTLLKRRLEGGLGRIKRKTRTKQNARFWRINGKCKMVREGGVEHG